MRPFRGLCLTRELEGQHGAVHQWWFAEDAALRVEPFLSGVQHDGGTGYVGACGGGRQTGRHGGEGRPGGCGDEHVASAGTGRSGLSCDGSCHRRGLPAAWRENGQPDLHRRLQSLQHGVPGRGAASDGPHPAGRHGTRGLPSHGSVLGASSHLHLTTRPATGDK